ncbi:MAG: hypothetical protein WD711_07600 [Dongiaceae bacterium]
MAAPLALLAAAVTNNALWCDAICRAHERVGEFSPHHWLCRVDVPPFYPNLVTLGDASLPPVAAQLDAIDRLMAANLSPGWALKDSFAALDLSSRGFSRLFDAVWIGRDAGLAVDNEDSLHMVVVRDAGALAAWETAWRRDQGPDADALPVRLFPDSLLDDPEIAFLAAIGDGGIVAGAAANRGAGVAGITNLFCGGEDMGAVWAGVVALLSRRDPELPLIGYEPADTMGLLRSLDFAMLGTLAVWLAPE